MGETPLVWAKRLWCGRNAFGVGETPLVWAKRLWCRRNAFGVSKDAFGTCQNHHQESFVIIHPGNAKPTAFGTDQANLLF